ncbi:DNA-binding protein [Pantoea osteomyelitidis]|uniref:DNA-binding protein n=1 Tax=Pantoea osteomyelitidis TaxID=3230026 RepID=A0ABW7Q122_9GAMM
MNTTTRNELNNTFSAEQAAIIERMNMLSAELVVSLTENKNLSRALSMTDSELVRLMFETQLDRVSEMSPREKRRIAHLNDSAIRFAERLNALGGTCRASRAAEILGVKRQTINNRLKANRLLAVKTGGESRFPLFQFDGNKLVDGIEEVLDLLGDISPVTKTSFLTAMYFFDNEPALSVIDALKQYGSSGKHMDEIRRQAKLFGHQVAH